MFAFLPNNWTPGSYILKVTNILNNQADSFYLTMGNTGPQGPAGPQGDTGLQGPAGTTGQSVSYSGPGSMLLPAGSPEQATAIFATTTAATDKIIVAYGLVVRNSGGSICSVIAHASLDGVATRQTVIQVQPGVGSGGQTVVFSPSYVGGAYDQCACIYRVSEYVH